MIMMMMPSTTASSSHSCLLKTLLLLAASLCGSASAANNIGRIDAVADIEGVGVGADPNPTKKKVVFASPSSSSAAAATPHDAPVIDRRRNNRNLKELESRRKVTHTLSRPKREYDDVFKWTDTGSAKAAKAASSMSAEEKIALHRRFDESHASKLTLYLQLISSADESATDAELKKIRHLFEDIVTEINDYSEIVGLIISQSDSAPEVIALYNKMGMLYLNQVDILPEPEGDRGILLATATSEDAFSRAQEIAEAENLQHFIPITAFNRAFLFFQYAQDQAKAAAVAAETLEYVTEGSDVVAVGEIAFQAACSREEISAADADACSESAFQVVPSDVEACSFPQVFACTLYELLFEDEGDQHSKVAVTLTYSVYNDSKIIPSTINEVGIQGHTEQQELFNTIEEVISEALAYIIVRFPAAAGALSGWDDQSISDYNSDEKENKIRVAFSSYLDSSHHDDALYALAILGSRYAATPWAAFIIGMIGGWVYLGASALILRLKIDDAVDAIPVPVHFANGMGGCIGIVGFFAEPSRVVNWSVDGTAKSGVGIEVVGTANALVGGWGNLGGGVTQFVMGSMGVMNPGLVMRNIIPVAMAGVLGIYGLIIAVIIQGSIVAPQNGLSQYSLYTGFADLADSLRFAHWRGHVGDAGVRAVGQQEKLNVGMILILIFAEALGLYGLIVALILS